MDNSIDFHDHARGKAAKVNDVGADRMLAAKLQATRSESQLLP